MAAEHNHLHADTTYKELKYLGLVEAAGSLASVVVVRLYEVGKEWSGSYRPRIDHIEVKVKEAIAPFYYFVRGKEHQILLFFDHKLDVIVGTLRKHAPHALKRGCDHVVATAKKVPDFVIEVSAEVHRVGVIDTARGYFSKVEPIAEEWLYYSYKQFLKLPYSVKFVHVASPHALFVGSKVNQLLSSLKARNIPCADYVPLLPLNRIESVIKKDI